MATAFVHRVVVKGVQTIGAVNAIIASFNPGLHLPAINNLGLRCEGRLVGRDGTPATITVGIKAAVNIAAGVVGLDGASIAEAAIGNAGLAAATGFFNINGANTIIQLNATGVAAATITWTGYIDFWST